MKNNEAFEKLRKEVLDRVFQSFEVGIAELEKFWITQGTDSPLVKMADKQRRMTVFIDLLAGTLSREHHGGGKDEPTRSYAVMFAAMLDCLHMHDHKYHDDCIEPEDLFEAIMHNYNVLQGPPDIIDVLRQVFGPGLKNVKVVDMRGAPTEEEAPVKKDKKLN